MKKRPPVLAHERFSARAPEFERLPVADVFTRIHATNLWGSDDSVSGLGSELDATARLRDQLPRLLAELGARSLLDVPCGDFEWMSRVDLAGVEYIGADIVAALIEHHRARWPERRFELLDLCASPLPRVDVVFCRDCLVHLADGLIRQAVANLKQSSSTWLLTTTFPECTENRDIQTGDWRMLNFELPPWNWPKPERLLVEGCTEAGGGYEDKSLGLWRIAELSAE
jgi:SAM-dependent methyltransferase